MRLIVDAMGGDNAPGEITRGAVEAAREYDLELTLVGPEATLRQLLAGLPPADGITIHHAPEVVGPDEQPRRAYMQKKASSLRRGLELLRDKQGDAFISAGNTGALLMSAVLTLGTLPGLVRPALASVLPTLTGQGFMMLDLGAYLDSSPENLYQYALMGSLWMGAVHRLPRPRVALLNVGEERQKGERRVQDAYHLLAGDKRLNFIGNVEGRDLFRGAADVVVCDGFVGNVVLKVVEGTGDGIFRLLRTELTGSPRAKVGAWLSRPALKAVARRMDYTEYGGAPFLGVERICIKCHGSSNAKAIRNGLRVAREVVASGVVDHIKANLHAGSPDPTERRGPGSRAIREGGGQHAADENL